MCSFSLEVAAVRSSFSDLIFISIDRWQGSRVAFHSMFQITTGFNNDFSACRMLIDTQRPGDLMTLLDYGFWHVVIFCQMIINWRQHCTSQVRSSVLKRWHSEGDSLICNKNSSCISFVALLTKPFLLRSTSIQCIFTLTAVPFFCILVPVSVHDNHPKLSWHVPRPLQSSVLSHLE